MNLSKISPQDMIVWGLALYGGYRLIKTQTSFLNVSGSQLGDSNNDGIVNQTDMDYVVNNWMQPGDVYDSNDNIVNLDDLSLVQNNWLQGQSTSGSTGGTTSGTTGPIGPLGPTIQREADFKSRMTDMGCKGNKQRKRVLSDKLRELKLSGKRPAQQDRLRNKISLIEAEMRNKGC